MGVLRKNLWWLLVVVAAIAAACGSSESTEASAAQAETASTTTSTTTSAPVELAEPEPAPSVVRATRLASTAPIDLAITNDRRLTVTFMSGAHENLLTRCGWDVQLDVEETAFEVRVLVNTVRVLEPDASDDACALRLATWAVTTNLTEPLGERTLVDARTQSRVPTHQIETRLLPLQLPTVSSEGEEPFELSLESDDGLFPLRTMVYAGLSATSERSSVTVISHPSAHPNDLFRLRDNAGWAAFTVRNASDGVIGPAQGTETSIWFEEDGWVYRILGENVPASTVIDFSQSFDNPALVDEDDLSLLRTPATFQTPLQVGQEGLESGLLDVLPGDRAHAEGRIPAPPLGSNEPIPGEPIASEVTRFPGNARVSNAFTIGRDLTVVFEAGRPGVRPPRCQWSASIAVDESPDAVEVRVDTVGETPPGGSADSCTAFDEFWAITTTLDAPLGDRPLVDAVFDTDVVPVPLEPTLLPTRLPAETGEEGEPVPFILRADNARLPSRLLVYGPAVDWADSLVRVTIRPLGRATDLHGMGWEPITVRSPNDGILNPGASAATELWFEEEGWVYRFSASAGVDESAVIDFARSFERPALADEAGLAVQRLEPLRPIELQPGQEERSVVFELVPRG